MSWLSRLLAYLAQSMQSMTPSRSSKRQRHSENSQSGVNLLDLPNDCLWEVMLRVRCPRSLAAGAFEVAAVGWGESQGVGEAAVFCTTHFESPPRAPPASRASSQSWTALRPSL